MKTELNQSLPIFWKGKLCKFIKWETLNFGGKLKIKIIIVQDGATPVARTGWGP